MTDGFVPRHERVAEERVEALQSALESALLDGIDLVAIASLCLATVEQNHRRHLARAQALENVMEAILDFDVRCEAGDVEGAVAALRAWYGKVRS